MLTKNNLKDPTICKCLSACFLVLLCNMVRMVEGFQGDGISNGRSRQNVSCIAHDTKFTCDCRNINTPLHLPHLEGFVYQIEIQNCKSLTIDANALADTQGLRKITIRQIDNLLLNKYSLVYPRYASNTPLIFDFHKVNFELIDSHAINGNIEEIYFIDCRIRVINPFGFTTLKERATLLRMDNVIVERIEQQAFKKFAVEQLEIMNSKFDMQVPSKAFYELEVLATLRIHNVHFKAMHTRAFSFKKASRLSISNSIFESTEAEWIEAFVKENVMLQNNHFGLTNEIAFNAIGVHREYILSEPLELRFLNNTVMFPLHARPLQFNEKFNLIITQLRYENEFHCENLDNTQSPPRPMEEFFNRHIDTISMRHNRSASMNGHLSSEQSQSFVPLSQIILWECVEPSYLLYIILGGIFASLLILLLIGTIVYVKVSKRRKLRKLDLIMPEPRTYKETQIVYQIENAGLLKTDL